MGLTDVVHRKEKSEELKKQDFYQTHPSLVRALMEGMKDIKLFNPYFADTAKVLDSCAGQGSIGTVLKEHFKNVTEYDLYSGYKEKRDFMDEDRKFDLIVINPPYSSKGLFIHKCLDVAEFSFILMPENVTNYRKMNEEFFSSKEYVGKIKTWPKHFMTESVDKLKFGGMSSYSFYLFTSNRDWQIDYSKVKFEVIKDIRNFM